MQEVTDELERRLAEEKKQMENDVINKWNEKYEMLESDCKANLRDDKEKRLMNNMYNKLKSKVEEKIYQSEYPNIEKKIRMDVEEKLVNEIRQKKMLEIDVEKRKLESFTKKKLEEIETSLKAKCKESYEDDLRREIESKEKELKQEYNSVFKRFRYMKKFNNYKNNLETKLKNDYDLKKDELDHELKELKNNAYRQKCSEKLKMTNINKMKQNLNNKEKILNSNTDKIDKALVLNNSKIKGKKSLFIKLLYAYYDY